MSTEESNDLSRPKVQVTLPAIKLQLKDLSFLRSLAQPKGVRCHADAGVLDRLRFLDLIARANVPVTQAKRTEINSRMSALKLDLRSAIKAEKWDRASELAYTLKREAKSLEPSEDDVLTSKGADLLRQGEVTVRVRKVGCAK